MREGKKKNVMVYLDPEIVKEARELGLNISKVCENALKEAIMKLKSNNNERARRDLNPRLAAPKNDSFNSFNNTSLEGISSSYSKDLRIIDNSNDGPELKDKEVLEKFKEYLEIDRRLEKGTIRRHLLEIRRLLKYGKGKFDILRPRKEDLREYLGNFIDIPAGSYANILKSLRVFYRDFLGMGEVIEGFRFPNRPLSVVKIPSKEEIREFIEGIKDIRVKTFYLILAVSGLRYHEAKNLRIGDVDFKNRMIIPNNGNGSRTKRAWITFYNEEVEELLKEYLGNWENIDKNERLFKISEKKIRAAYREYEKKKGVKITPQILREWFNNELLLKGIQESYVNAFCGRIPKSVLGRHYVDYRPERLKEVYEKAGLRVLKD